MCIPDVFKFLHIFVNLLKYIFISVVKYLQDETQVLIFLCSMYITYPYTYGYFTEYLQFVVCMLKCNVLFMVYLSIISCILLIYHF